MIAGSVLVAKGKSLALVNETETPILLLGRVQPLVGDAAEARTSWTALEPFGG